MLKNYFSGIFFLQIFFCCRNLLTKNILSTNIKRISMKRLLFATIMLLAFFACDEDEVVGWKDDVRWDISPIEFRILVLDENGNDLITDKENSDVLQGLKLW